jgi:hypothetical protein
MDPNPAADNKDVDKAIRPSSAQADDDIAADATPVFEPSLKLALVRLLHPITMTVMVMLVGVTLLVAANVVGWDRGRVLTHMGGREFARGLITYIFAVTTIGTAVVLVLAALMGEIGDRAYQRGKEILALLLGLFGTIVGFYFGAESHPPGNNNNGAAPAATSSMAPATTLSVSPPLLAESRIAAGSNVNVTALVSGGTPPYRFSAGVFPGPRAEGVARSGGWIVVDVAMPPAMAGKQRLVLDVSDARGAASGTEAVIDVASAKGP